MFQKIIDSVSVAKNKSELDLGVIILEERF